ncbi:helix-turn-helix domain-containing protein [Streptomyces sp. NPDC090493]|uniref:helix-turn-helix domain-containing protein n=1 Tax=Streptomyces sp. NPDC090493 TaxID=3365964 RepID=UPI00382797DC
MNRRRLELHMTWRELSTNAGISYEALRAVRRGDYRPTALTARALDDALGWAPGSVYSVLDGGQPVLAADTSTPPPDGPSTPTEADSGRLSSRELEALADMVASAADGFDLTPEQLDQAYARARRLVEEKRQARSKGEQGPRTGRAS